MVEESAAFATMLRPYTALTTPTTLINDFKLVEVSSRGDCGVEHPVLSNLLLLLVDEAFEETRDGKW